MVKDAISSHACFQTNLPPVAQTDNHTPDTETVASDSERLLQMVAESLSTSPGTGPMQFGPSSFNSEGTPEVLYVGRGPEGEVAWAIWTGRSELKSQVKPDSKDLYKLVRQSLFSYQMGEEIPVLVHGEEGVASHAVVTFDDNPKIKSPRHL